VRDRGSPALRGVGAARRAEAPHRWRTGGRIPPTLIGAASADRPPGAWQPLRQPLCPRQPLALVDMEC